MLSLFERNNHLFDEDILINKDILEESVKNSSFLVLGGAGTIGQSVTKQIFIRSPKKLHVVDISENNLVELVRDIRSSYGYMNGDFKTFALDIGSNEYDFFIENDGKYDYVLNLSALKHVRSEEDPYTLMRMINVNILNTEKTIKQSIRNGVKKYFCVSTDKATNPVNMMGASKRIMEFFLMKYSNDICISTARFANVAFSDGSLLDSFQNRLKKHQPIVAPYDIKRYFIIPKEAGELCLMSCILGENRDIFFPKLSAEFKLISFSEIALKYLEKCGLEPLICETEDEARSKCINLENSKKIPCLFVKSDTTGEKDYEEFYTKTEELNLTKYNAIGIIKNSYSEKNFQINYFKNEINDMKNKKYWTKKELIELFKKMIENFDHKEKGKYLDSKM